MLISAKGQCLGSRNYRKFLKKAKILQAHNFLNIRPREMFFLEVVANHANLKLKVRSGFGAFNQSVELTPKP